MIRLCFLKHGMTSCKTCMQNENSCLRPRPYLVRAMAKIETSIIAINPRQVQANTENILKPISSHFI